MEVLDVVVAKVDAVQQYLAFGRIVESSYQLYDRRFPLAVLADQGHPFSAAQLKVQAVENQPRAPGIVKRNISKLKSVYHRPRHRKRIRLGPDGGLHCEEGQQVREEQCLVGDPRER